MSCEIIQFSTAARIPSKRRKPIVLSAGTSHMSRVELEQEPERPARDEGELTVTCQNRRLRDARKDAWREAGAIREYWKARLEMESAIEVAQRHDLPEGNNHPPHNPDERWTLLANWRQAIAQQLLTPAPDTAAVAWKKAALDGGQHEFTDVKTERIQRAIASDLAFLAEHPVRRSNSEAMAHRRAFQEAMRQRIRDVAASRDLSDEEIKPVLTLKHLEIAEFTEKHGVNLEWLLEGKGRIFEKDPIGLSPNMTGTELAAVVSGRCRWLISRRSEPMQEHNQ
jgi:hypothetical protein